MLQQTGIPSQYSYNKLLADLGNKLATSEFQDLKNLCKGIIVKRDLQHLLKTVSILHKLGDYGYISREDLTVLQVLLMDINRRDLCNEIGQACRGFSDVLHFKTSSAGNENDLVLYTHGNYSTDEMRRQLVSAVKQWAGAERNIILEAPDGTFYTEEDLMEPSYSLVSADTLGSRTCREGECLSDIADEKARNGELEDHLSDKEELIVKLNVENTELRGRLSEVENINAQMFTCYTQLQTQIIEESNQKRMHQCDAYDRYLKSRMKRIYSGVNPRSHFVQLRGRSPSVTMATGVIPDNSLMMNRDEDIVHFLRAKINRVSSPCRHFT